MAASVTIPLPAMATITPFGAVVAMTYSMVRAVMTLSWSTVREKGLIPTTVVSAIMSSKLR
jgi:hypothetical protein